MKREKQRQLWLDDYFKGAEFSVEPASEDASFRSYFRIKTTKDSYVLMDAPPEHEDCRPFVAVSELLHANQVNVPHLYAVDLDHGFLMLGDFGDQLYLASLNQNNDNHHGLYQDAIDAMLLMQSVSSASQQLPTYDESLLLTEMSLFKKWFINKHLSLELDANELEVLNEAFALLCHNALEQPQVMVHRDFHSRNLMVLPDNNPGVIDFQDAVYGPMSYDLASLLKDCYINWPDDVVEQHCQYYLQQYNQRFNTDIKYSQLIRWFNLMAVQRHLKAVGIFCRLNYRDGKSGYLSDIPRTMKYLLEGTAQYPELTAFNKLLHDIQPVLPQGPTTL